MISQAEPKNLPDRLWVAKDPETGKYLRSYRHAKKWRVTLVDDLQNASALGFFELSRFGCPDHYTIHPARIALGREEA